MATLSNTICSVCEIQHKTKEAEYWCPECEQSLCPECLNYHNALKSSRNHEVIPVENYKQLPSSISTIQQHCLDHDRKFQMYCPQHENVCCPLCISSNHRNCVGLLSVEEVIATSKTSSLLDSTEQRLKDLLTNAEEIIDDRKQNLTSIQNQHHKFQSEVTQMRDQINKHLDFLEKQSFEELQATKKDVSSQIETVITNVTQNYKHVSELKNEMGSIRKHASNLQTFLGAKILEKSIQKKEEYLQSLSVDGSLQQVLINLEVNGEVSKILSIQKFGSVSTESGSSLVLLKKETNKQAQILRMSDQTRRSIQDIKLTLQRTMIFPENMTGSWFNPSRKFIVVIFSEAKLIIFGENGTLHNVINTSTKPVDVTCIDDITVAISFYGSPVIQIVNIMTKNVERTINAHGSCSGITYKNNKILCCVFRTGIRMINLTNTDNTLLVKNKELENFNNITTSTDNLYYTNRKVVYCYSLTGEKLWEFKDASLLKNTWGLCLDKDFNIYVADRGNISVLVISPDGEKGRRILGREDDVYDPRGLSFNKEDGTLLVTNSNGISLLYKKSIIMQKKTIQLILKELDGRTHVIVIDSNAIISELFKKAAERTGLKECDIRLLYASKELLKTDTNGQPFFIGDYRILDDGHITLVLRLLGGSNDKDIELEVNGDDVQLTS